MNATRRTRTLKNANSKSCITVRPCLVLYWAGEGERERRKNAGRIEKEEEEDYVFARISTELRRVVKETFFPLSLLFQAGFKRRITLRKNTRIARASGGEEEEEELTANVLHYLSSSSSRSSFLFASWSIGLPLCWKSPQLIFFFLSLSPSFFVAGCSSEPFMASLCLNDGGRIDRGRFG